MIHGCDYNPEQWLHRPDILKRDIELMGEAGINQVSLGIFSWSVYEPREGEYNFAWLDEAMDRLHGAGIGVCLGTATAAYPVWMAKKYPEIVRLTADGKPSHYRYGRRHDFCWSSPVFREKSAALIHQLADRYAHHPALASWHVNNEYGGTLDHNRCYCPRCLGNFHDWLRRRYQNDISKLNLSWWSSFWSKAFTTWEEIEPGNSGLGALTINWQRFCTEQVADFLSHEIRAIRQFSQAPVTTNLHANGKSVDDVLLARQLDFVGFDHYPPIDGTARDLQSAIEGGWEGDRMRCLLHKPWLLLESCPSQPQYFPHMRAKRPGVHRQLSLQHVAHGSEGVCYFQWRAGRGGIEKLHGAVNMWDAPEHTRVFAEVAELGRDLQCMDSVVGSGVVSEVAILWDVHTEWHSWVNNGLNNVEKPRERAMRWYGELWKANIPVDVIHPGDEHLETYKLVLIPGLIMLPEGVGGRLRRAVENGATVVGDPLTAWLDEDHSILPGGRLGPELRELFGIACEEFDCLRKDEKVSICSHSPLLPAETSSWEISDLVNTDTAQVLAKFTSEFYSGRPALTRNLIGKGAAYYVCATLREEALRTLLLGLCEQLGIHPPIAGVPEGMQARARTAADGSVMYFLSNFSNDALSLLLPMPMKDLLDGERELKGVLNLAPRDVRLLRADIIPHHEDI